MRNSMACLLLSAAFFALPLAFMRLGGEKIPFYGMVEAVTLPVAGIITLAAAILFADWRIYRDDLRWQLFGVAQITIIGVAFLNASPENILNTTFYLFAPLAGAALQQELKRFLPFFATLWSSILLISGIASENFTGFTGNWNWTQALLAALLPGAVLLLELPRWKLLSALLLFGIMLGIWFNCPAQFSRVIFPAAGAAFGMIYCARKIESRHKLLIYTLIFSLVAFAFFTVVAFAEWQDSRFQLWKGAADLALANCFSGVGMGNFASAVQHFIPENYFFTPFAAPWHPHPHNELLNFLCAYGIAGGFYIFALTAAVFTAKKTPDRRTQFATWIFVFLLICGMFDMSCVTVAGAMWCFLSAGIAIGTPCRKVFPKWRQMIPAAILLLFAVREVNNTVTSTMNLRRGEIALFKKDVENARRCLRRSSAPLAQYHLAELELLLFNDPHYALNFYQNGQKVFLHSQRLLALSLQQKGQYAAALTAMKEEISRYPFSVINARLYCIMLKNAGAPADEISAAKRRFQMLCDLRKISPAAAVTLLPAQDDLPIPR